jgi:hypothetical protein
MRAKFSANRGGVFHSVSPQSMKTGHLIVYDYGMGGVWGVMHARSADEICRRYPELKVIDARPEWLNEELYANIVDKSSYDIDEEPTGWLRTLIEERPDPAS